ncbi:MAG: LysM peptidoglycan-binding domain-containing protein, partial [Bacteroidales bacterium]|nr:LysM peptidoglycan-binding domain-containing protein [Bacteroidales bacterium]
MKKNKILLLTLLLGWLLALPCWTFAQEVQVKRAEKTVVIGGKKFYMHHVNAGETLYAISKAYCVSEDDIMTYNPDLKRTGLKAKTVIGIPYVEKTEDSSQKTEDSSQKTEVVAAKPETVAPKPETVTPKPETVAPKPVKDTIVTIGGKRYVMHYVLAGETLWGVSHAFNVSEEEILDKNPEIKDGLKAGMVVGIPYVEKPEAVTPQPTVKPVEPEPVVATVEPEKPAVPEEPEKPAAPEEPEPEVVPADSEGPKLVVVKPEPTVLSPVSDDDEYHDGYVIHTVKKSEKTRSMLHGWNVSEEEFRQLNPSVGSRVFVGQKVLIPIVSHKDGPSTPTEPEILNEPAAPVEPEVSGEPEVPVEPEASTADESVAEHPVEEPEVMDENPEMRLIYPEEKPFSCYSSRTYADQTYKVALLVPLYLDEVDKVNTARSRNGRTKKARSLRFLQFYEGFMMAVDSLTEYHGLNLDLTVIDVTEDTTKAVAAVEKLRGQDVDLIIGPFFSKSFAVVEDYAALRDILVVNPLSERESVVVDADNVVKLKPSPQSMVTELTRLIRTKYPKSKVTLITPSNVKDTVMVQAIENALAVAVQPEVQLSNAEMVELITRESQRRKMGKRV